MSQNLLSKFFHELAELSTKYAALAEGMPEVPDNAGTGRKAKSKKDPNKPSKWQQGPRRALPCMIVV